MNKKSNISLIAWMLLGTTVLLTACKKNIPDERLSLGNDSQFTTTVYQPVLGRNSLFSDNFNAASSSLPLNFKIVNMRRFNGDPAPELTNYYPVQVWKSAYTGTEKSLAEIEAKRTIENHQLFEIREHSGQFVMWAAATSNNGVKSQVDSGYVFDVEMSNSGGRRYFKDFKLRPYKERAFEPSNLDPLTGQATSVGVRPSLILNIKGERTNRYLGSGDIEVMFRKINSSGNSLSFKFVDTLQNPIDPDKFNFTKWNMLVHGFDMVKDTEKVTYKVAYPIPLVPYPTIYTTGGGQQASVVFGYKRQGLGNQQEVAALGLNFNIFEKGDWEIVFWFKTEKPKFVND